MAPIRVTWGASSGASAQHRQRLGRERPFSSITSTIDGDAGAGGSFSTAGTGPMPITRGGTPATAAAT